VASADRNGLNADGLSAKGETKEDPVQRPTSNHPYQSAPLPSDPFCPSRLDICHESDSEKGRIRLTWSLIASTTVAIILLLAAVYYGLNARTSRAKVPTIAMMQNGPDSWSGQTAQNSPPMATGTRDVTQRK
jgi:hypothetical protein